MILVVCSRSPERQRFQQRFRGTRLGARPDHNLSPQQRHQLRNLCPSSISVSTVPFLQERMLAFVKAD